MSLLSEKTITTLSDLVSEEDFVARLRMDDTGFILSIYRLILNREPDAEGLAHHLTLLQGGLDRKAIATELLRSNESRDLLLVNQVISREQIDALIKLGDEAFLEAAYGLLFDRQPDPIGRESHLQAMAAGKPRMQVLAGLVRSDEARQYYQLVDPQFHEIVVSEAPSEAPSEASPQEGRLTRLLSRIGVTGPQPSVVSDLERHVVELTVPFSLRLKDGGIGFNPFEDQGASVDLDANSGWKNGARQSAEFLKAMYTPRVDGPILWFDLTTTMEWSAGVVGIIRAELEVAAAIRHVNPNVRYSMQLGNGFVEIEPEKLNWLFEAENVADAYVEKFNRGSDKVDGGQKPTYVQLGIKKRADAALNHPFRSNDIVYAMGWLGSQKEAYFSIIKATLPDLHIVYLIYDTILVGETTSHFYDLISYERFEKYVEWISRNANAILYGGATAKADTERFQRERGWPTLPGYPIQFGTDIVKAPVDESDVENVLAEMGVQKPFVVTVGSLEPRKNHESLYKAYLMALESDPQNVPQLVIVGKPMWRNEDLVNYISRDPRVKGKIVILRPSDLQLAVLYRECLFTILSSVYEGWSLTLPESLGQGKFCLTAKTPPLIEIGKDMVDYVEPFDVRGWADAILKYAKQPDLVKVYEGRIKANWPTTYWMDSAKMINSSIMASAEKARELAGKVHIWYDLTLSFLHAGGRISGIVRAELIFARYLKQLYPEARFFAHRNKRIFEIDQQKLLWLFNDADLTASYKNFADFWSQAEAENRGYRYPTDDTDPSHLEVFPPNSAVLFTGIDSDGTGKIGRCGEAWRMAQLSFGVTLVQLIYDFTPFLIPQCHLATTCEAYEIFIEYVFEHFDLVVYGGRTAQLDAEALQHKNGWRSPEGRFIEFGSDIGSSTRRLTKAFEKERLSQQGIKDRFIMTVGTIEPRKNHEMLYKAYVSLYEHGVRDMPQFVFVGKPGWLTNDFLEILGGDHRLKDYILIISPDDELLDIMYRNCLFTVLASFYEGWSLTLPESLSYGKFCLVSDVPPLKEVGRDLVEYINPYDTYGWAERIMHYAENPAEVKIWERKIKTNWKSKSWEQSTKEFLGMVLEYHNTNSYSSNRS